MKKTAIFLDLDLIDFEGFKKLYERLSLFCDIQSVTLYSFRKGRDSRFKNCIQEYCVKVNDSISLKNEKNAKIALDIASAVLKGNYDAVSFAVSEKLAQRLTSFLKDEGKFVITFFDIFGADIVYKDILKSQNNKPSDKSNAILKNLFSDENLSVEDKFQPKLKKLKSDYINQLPEDDFQNLLDRFLSV